MLEKGVFAMGSADQEKFLISNYLVEDVRNTALKVAINEGWYKQHWLGTPLWQLPEDLIFLQTIISTIKPSLIIETGTKYGGSALFFASILTLLELPNSRIVTIDITETSEALELLPHNRLTKDRVKRIIGSATDIHVLEQVNKEVSETQGPVIIFLDDWHGGEHVLEELNSYQAWVGSDGLLIVADTSFADLAGTPIAPYRSLLTSNPRTAINKFLESGVSFCRSDRFKPMGLSNFSDGVLERIQILT